MLAARPFCQASDFFGNPFEPRIGHGGRADVSVVSTLFLEGNLELQLWKFSVRKEFRIAGMLHGGCWHVGQSRQARTSQTTHGIMPLLLCSEKPQIGVGAELEIIPDNSCPCVLFVHVFHSRHD